MLPIELDETLADLLAQRCRRLGCVLVAAGTAPDHVHALVRLDAMVPVAMLAQHLKGGSAHELNRRRLSSSPLSWQTGYWAASVGTSELGALVRYVGSQRRHHDDAHPAERWQLDVERTATEVARPRGGL